MSYIIEDLLMIHKRPKLFEQGETKFWHDPYISKSMLEAHLISLKKKLRTESQDFLAQK